MCGRVAHSVMKVNVVGIYVLSVVMNGSGNDGRLKGLKLEIELTKHSACAEAGLVPVHPRFVHTSLRRNLV